MKPNEITIFTDGSSKGNPGPGGWGAIIKTDGKVRELGGREEHTTNNRMEMMAVIKALEFVWEGRLGLPEVLRSVSLRSIRATPPSGFTEQTSDLLNITIFTDSSYVAKGASEWLAGWQKKGWKNSQKQAVLNRDLWEKIAELKEKFAITWKIIPGHAGIPENERCDVIATSFADNSPVNLAS